MIHHFYLLKTQYLIQVAILKKKKKKKNTGGSTSFIFLKQNIKQKIRLPN